MVISRLGKKTQELIYDWIGRADVERRTEGTISPFRTLQQALAILALVVSGPLLNAISESVPSNVLVVVRIFFLAIVVILANHVVVSKQYSRKTRSRKHHIRETTLPAAPKLAYRYTEIDRLASKIVLPFSVILMIILLWPEPNPCFLSAKLHHMGDSRSGFSAGMYLEITGGGETTQFPLTTSGTSEIAISPDQQGNWTIEIKEPEGVILGYVRLEGCLDEEREFRINDKTIFMLQPR